MAEFVVNIWHNFKTDDEFENTIPLIFNGVRMQTLGHANKIHLLFITGYERLSAPYLNRLRELGYQVHDCTTLAAEIGAEMPLFVEKYKLWGGIRHYGLLRFLLMPRVFGKAEIITFDADMVVNAALDDIEAALQGGFYALDGSSCFVSIPAGGGFFDVFEENLMAFQKNPDGYAKDVMRLESAAQFFDPHFSGGTDQAFLLHLLRSGLVVNEVAYKTLMARNLYPFSNWITIDARNLGRLTYRRVDGVDYINDMKIMISHMSHDACGYFGQFILLKRLLQDGIERFGRLPLPYGHYEASEAPFKVFLDRQRHAFNDFPAMTATGLNPFARAEVIRYFYEENDFSAILNDRLWHKAGVFG